MNLRTLLHLCVLLSAAALSASATAATYCVSDVAALQSAITVATTAPGDSVHEIRLRPGTYALPAGLEFAPTNDLLDNKDFSITGGWNAGCTLRTINAAATVIDGTAAGFDGSFHFGGNQERIVIEGLRFINFHNFQLDDELCFGSPASCPDTSTVRLRYNEFRNGDYVLVDVREAPVMNVSNNLFAGISAQGTNPGVFLRSSVATDAPVIAFNTFADISCPTPTAVTIAIDASGASVHHNIFESSCSVDVFFSGVAGVALRNNLYNAKSGNAPTASSGNVISNTPGFINAAGGDYHLRDSAPVSPGVNAGMTLANTISFGLSPSTPAQDLDGPAGGRLVGANYDIGAYESALDNSAGTTITVVNTNDSGAGSLRQAILSANASPGEQTVQFNIAGTCPRIILLDTPLPDVVDDLAIDGYTQPGASPNTAANGSDAQLCVVVGASAAGGTLAQALQVPIAAPAATNLTVKGIAFLGSTGFNGNFTVALRLRGGSNHLIQGNAFSGTGPGSVGSLGTMNFGIQVRDNAQNALIGGSEPEHRNSFGSMSSSAIVLNDASSGGHIIQNNYIGLSASGQAASTIGLNGIFASASPNVQILDNVIAAVPTSAAISITGASASGYSIQRNRIGVNAFGVPTAALRNGVGIQINSGSGGHMIGSLLGLAPSNLITNSDGAGIWITTTAGSGTLIRPNQIFDNGVSGLGLGVDIGPLGQSSNDAQDPDGGPNNGQNYPEITASLPNANGSRQVTVSLDSNPSTSFRIDVYRSPSCLTGNRGGNMLNRVGTVQTTANANGIASASFEVNGGGAPGLLVAQATNLTTKDSSEPSLCFIEPIATTTTITNDSPDASQFGQAYTVTVLVTAASGEPTGSITVSDGDGNQCTDSTLSGGIGSCQLPSFSVGNKTLTANYSGSLSHAPSSDSEPHSVVAATTTTTIVGDAPDSSEVGQPYMVQVQVRTQPGNTATPAGPVAISDGSGQTCQIATLSNGDGACQLTSVTAGVKTLSASFQSNPNFDGSSDTEAHNVVPAATTTTITTDAPDQSLPGQSYLVAVAVSSQLAQAGTLNYSFASTSGATIPAGGTLVSGSQGDDAVVDVAVPAGFNFSVYGTPVGAGSALRLSTNGNLQIVGSGGSSSYANATLPSSGIGFPLAAPVLMPFWDDLDTSANAVTGGGIYQQVTGSAPTRKWIIEWRGERLGTAGSAITLKFAIELNENSSTFAYVYELPADGGTSATVGVQAATTGPVYTQYSFNAGALTAGQRITGTLSAALGVPTGTVAVSDGAGANCNIALAGGSGFCQLTSATVGNRTLTANYTPNSQGFAASSDTEAHQVALAATTTTIISDQPDPSLVGQAYLVQAQVAAPAATGNYNFVSTSGATIPVGGTLVTGSQTDDAVVDLVVPVGFNCSVYGTTISAGNTLRVSTNGNLQIVSSGGSADYGNSALPNLGTANGLGAFPAALPVLMPFWDDLTTLTNVVTGGGIYQQVTGTAPNRKWIIEWRGKQLGNPSTAVTLKFAIELFENSSSFAYVYELPGDGGANATIGVQGATTGSIYTQYSLNTNALTPGQRLTATLATALGAPSGIVSINDGTGASCDATLANGLAQCQLISTTPGTKTLTANYPGGGNFADSTDTETHTVNNPQAAATTTVINAQTPDPSVTGQPYTVSVSVSAAGTTPTGTVNINNGAGAGSSNCQTTLVNGSGSCQLTSNSAGMQLLTACLQANASFAGSCGNQNHITNKADTSIDIGGVNPSTVTIGQSTTVSATLNAVAPGAGAPTGVITVSASAAEQCTITLPATSCQLTLTTEGNRSITLNYPGDANFNPTVRTTSAFVQPDQLLKNGFE